MGKYDLSQKNLEHYPDVFADILNALLYGGRQFVRAEDLQPAPTETLYRSRKHQLRSQFHDVSKYETGHTGIKVQYTLENEMRCNRKMILRKAGYEGAVYREQYDGKIQETYPVIGTVLYWGKERWSASKSIHRFMRNGKISEEVMKYVDDIKLQVFDMRRLSKEVRSRFHSDMRIVDYLAQGKDYVPTEQPIRHMEALLLMLSELSHDCRYEQLLQQLQKEDKVQGGMTMCELLDKYEKRGIETGIATGEQLLASLMEQLFRDNRLADAQRVLTDVETRKRLYQEYKVG